MLFSPSPAVLCGPRCVDDLGKLTEIVVQPFRDNRGILEQIDALSALS